jgi:hypothetical protein
MLAEPPPASLQRSLSGSSQTAMVIWAVGEKSPLQCAGLNRHEGEDERALRVRSSDPLGPETCAADREGRSEA